VELLSTSADATPATFALATEVLRLPPLDGSAPVSAKATAMPTAFAFNATASPLNVVALCAKVAVALRHRAAVRALAVIEVLLMLMYVLLLP